MRLLSIAVHLYSVFVESVSVVLLIAQKRWGWAKRWAMDERIRLPYLERSCRDTGAVWLHAASLGECKLLLRVYETLARSRPGMPVVLTAATSTGVAFLRNHRPPAVAGVGFLPLDRLKLMRAMVARFAVKQVWLMETELWPAMLWVCREQGIPVGIMNARLEPSSFETFRRLNFLTGPLIQSLGPVLAQNQTYADRFVALGVPADRVTVVGNIKSHVSVVRPDPDWWLQQRQNMNLSEQDIVLTAGCVHPGEAVLVQGAVADANLKGLSFKLIIVPRHLDATSQILNELGGTAVHVTEMACTQRWEICVVGKYGVLDDLYALADVAFVGGTFVDIGGHNLWDPVRFGIPLFFGPHYHTQQESARRLLGAGVGFCVDNPAHMADSMYAVLKTNAVEFIRAQQELKYQLDAEQTDLEPYLSLAT